jgi:hypothetical protein
MNENLGNELEAKQFEAEFTAEFDNLDATRQAEVVRSLKAGITPERMLADMRSATVTRQLDEVAKEYTRLAVYPSKNQAKMDVLEKKMDELTAQRTAIFGGQSGDKFYMFRNKSTTREMYFGADGKLTFNNDKPDYTFKTN